jgi:carbonic anhydrase/acetyltransferase-like protein (isoleucine patch superfamily)
VPRHAGAMFLEHEGKLPRVDPSAYVAATATICGDVRIGPNCRILFGAVLTAEGGPVTLAEHVVVMENAVLRGTRRNPLTIGRHCLIGPRASLSGAQVDDEVFLATGSCVFNGARIEPRCEVRINGVVHLRTRLPEGSTVPIGWVAVGDPAQILPPSAHEEIWAVQERLDFPGYVFGLSRGAHGNCPMPELTRRYARALTAHQHDRPIQRPPSTVEDRR